MEKQLEKYSYLWTSCDSYLIYSWYMPAISQNIIRLSEIVSLPISQNNYSDRRGSLNSLQARTERKQKHILVQLCYENLITEQIFIQAITWVPAVHLRSRITLRCRLSFTKSYTDAHLRPTNVTPRPNTQLAADFP